MHTTFTAVRPNGGVLVDAYKNENRDWWNQVNEDSIYDTIGQKEFEIYLKLFVTEEAESSETVIKNVA